MSSEKNDSQTAATDTESRRTPPADSVEPGEVVVEEASREGQEKTDGTPQSGAVSEETFREVNERYLRLYADFENFKKRAAREREETRRSATEAMVSRLLPVVDTFEMAIAAARQPNTTVETLRMGVEMIQGQLKGVFTDVGVEEIDALGKPFDPACHDAVSQEESSAHPEGTVTQQTRKGYRLRERLIRPASVVVAKAPESPAAPDGQP